jgi:hypothetical protein
MLLQISSITLILGALLGSRSLFIGGLGLGAVSLLL